MKYAQNLKSKTIRAVLWSYASKYSSNLFLFISTLVLARLLVKEDFGIAGYALIIISFLEVLRGLGINSAIIFFPEDAERTNTGFWLTIGIGLLLFGLTWLGAPLVGQFFHDHRAIPVVRAMGLAFPINAFGAVHDALLRKKLAFNLSFIPNLTRGITKGFVSILLALYGFGVWSLVWGQLIAALTSVVAYWVVLPWRPALRFNPRYMRSLLSYGTKISIINSLAVLLNNVDYLLIGRYFNAATLGIYTLAFRIPEMTIKQLYVMVSNVIFPAFAEVQHDLALLRRGYFKTLSYVTIITVPMGLGLALVAKPFVLVFLTDKWAEAIPVIPPIALYTVLRSVEFSAGALYKATGLTELLVKIKIFQTIITLPALWWAAAYLKSIVAVGWTQVVLSSIAAATNIIVARYILQASMGPFLRSLLPATICGTVMALVVFLNLIATASATPLLQLISSCGVGAIAYVAALWLTQRDIMLDAGHTLRAAIIRR